MSAVEGAGGFGSKVSFKLIPSGLRCPVWKGSKPLSCGGKGAAEAGGSWSMEQG